MHGTRNAERCTALLVLVQRNKKTETTAEAVRALRGYEDEYEDGMTPAMVSAFLGEADEIRNLSSGELMQADAQRNTLLHYAAMGDAGGLLEILPGELHRMLNKREDTAAGTAARRGHAALFRKLIALEHGARGRSGMTALYNLIWTIPPTEATRICTREAAMYPDEMSRGMTPAMVWAHFGRVDMLARCTPEALAARDEEDNTLLHYAACGGAARVARFLRGRLAGNASSNWSETALGIAAVTGNGGVVAELAPLEGGMRMGFGRTALMDAVCSGDAQSCRRLLVVEAAMRDNLGDSALMHGLDLGRLPGWLLLRADKTAGQLFRGESLLETGRWQGDAVSELGALIAGNPIRAKETALARKHLALARGATGDAQEDRPFSERDWLYRQIQLENAFNRLALREAALSQDAIRPLPRHVHAGRQNRTRSRLQIARELFRAFRALVIAFLKREAGWE